MKVSALMTKNAEWISADAPLRDVARKMRDEAIGCLPVGEQDRLVGMITDRDITCRAVADGLDLAKAKARDVMTKGITWCFEDQTDKEALELMERHQIHHLPVLSRAKRIVGLLSIGDLAFRAKGRANELLHLAARDALRYQQAHGPH